MDIWAVMALRLCNGALTMARALGHSFDFDCMDIESEPDKGCLRQSCPNLRIRKYGRMHHPHPRIFKFELVGHTSVAVWSFSVALLLHE